MKDTSLRVPHGERGKVIARKEMNSDRDDLSPGVKKMVRLWIAQTRKITEGDKMAGRHGNKGVVAKILPEEDMPFLPDGTPVDIILNPIGVPSRMNLGQVLETHLGWAADKLNFRATTPVFDGAKDAGIEDDLARAWIIDQAEAADIASDNGYGTRLIDMSLVREWLEDRGYAYEPVFGEQAERGEASRVCLETWLREEQARDIPDATLAGMREEALRLNREEQIAAPTLGKSVLIDGRTGEPFDQPIAVGYIYMMKLIHLVEDKIHARSTGPYSLITQQPLGGKAQFGGQRFGEMEVWALEAYSAANNLQEMLTLKSDDVIGRVKTYEAIVKGENVTQPGVPESFHVLMKELQSLGLSVELLHESPEQFDDMDDLDDFQTALGASPTSLSSAPTTSLFTRDPDEDFNGFASPPRSPLPNDTVYDENLVLIAGSILSLAGDLLEAAEQDGSSHTPVEAVREAHSGLEVAVSAYDGTAETTAALRRAAAAAFSAKDAMRVVAEGNPSKTLAWTLESMDGAEAGWDAANQAAGIIAD